MSENVFAYGSNMCSGRFRHYRVNPQGEGLSAVLSDYRLRFNKLSKDGSAKANVEPYATGQVRGVIYAIPDGDLQVLDAGEVGYRRTKMQMQTHEGDITEAWIYIASEPSDDPDLRPYTWYRRFLVEGAREHSLPPEYIAQLERIEAVQDPKSQRDGKMRALASGVVGSVATAPDRR
jgi:gamma-glutamylcyclotransferase